MAPAIVCNFGYELERPIIYYCLRNCIELLCMTTTTLKLSVDTAQISHTEKDNRLWLSPQLALVWELALGASPARRRGGPKLHY